MPRVGSYHRQLHIGIDEELSTRLIALARKRFLLVRIPDPLQKRNGIVLLEMKN